jgi:16S rRNA (cytidine1402-2'-O)-methyltransferase
MCARERSAGEALEPGLYVVATPIGNLEDMTLRGLRVLRSVERIACEDTRHSARLLEHFEIATPTVSYHQHNEAARTAELIEELKSGARIAVISDAGTPGISDPGARLVAAAIAADVNVVAVPGANAAVTALIASGLPADEFRFLGFLPARRGERRSVLEGVRAEKATVIFYEAPTRIAGALQDVEAALGAGRRIVVARELTKLHEEILRGSVADVAAALAARESIRGEITLLIAGADGDASAATATSVGERVAELMQQAVSEKDALKQAARETGVSKSEAYREWQRVAAAKKQRGK